MLQVCKAKTDEVFNYTISNQHVYMLFPLNLQQDYKSKEEPRKCIIAPAYHTYCTNNYTNTSKFIHFRERTQLFWYYKSEKQKVKKKRGRFESKSSTLPSKFKAFYQHITSGFNFAYVMVKIKFCLFTQ